MSSSWSSTDGSDNERALPPVGGARRRKTREARGSKRPERASSGLKLPSLAPGGPVNIISNNPDHDTDDSVSNVGPIESGSEAEDSVDDDMDYEYSEDEDHVAAESGDSENEKEDQYDEEEFEEDDEEEEVEERPASPTRDTEEETHKLPDVNKEEVKEEIVPPLPLQEKDNKTLIEKTVDNEKEKAILKETTNIPKRPASASSHEGHVADKKDEVKKEKSEKKKKKGKKDGKKKGKEREEREKSAGESASDRERPGINPEEIPSDFE